VHDSLATLFLASQWAAGGVDRRATRAERAGWDWALAYVAAECTEVLLLPTLGAVLALRLLTRLVPVSA
jgi:hypothetical protein